MYRNRVAWAWGMTLAGGMVAANAFATLRAVATLLVDQSRRDPPPAPWYTDVAPHIMLGAALVMAWAVGSAAHAWAKARAGHARAPVAAPAPADAPEDDRIMAPPGFGAPSVRMRRVGAAPLLGWSAAGLLLLAVGAAVAWLGVQTLEQTTAMSGRGFGQAVLWSRLAQYAAAPLLCLGAGFLGGAWGRWFPLGALEVVRTGPGDAPQRPLHLKWQRHD